MCSACAYVRSMRSPSPLKEGSRVALVAPSGPLRGYADLERAITNTRMLGWEPVIGAHALERDTYLAGNDESRRADLNKFIADDSIDGIWCIRGGYGAMRLLNSLDYVAWRDKPKALIGYSDITALHAAVGPRADLVTYHGPTARTELTFSSASSRQTVDATLRIAADVPADRSDRVPRTKAWLPHAPEQRMWSAVAPATAFRPRSLVPPAGESALPPSS